MTGTFQVTWPEYTRNRTSCLNDLLKRNVFVDVTLVFDDEQMLAHKVILSSASSFFLQVLEKNVSHPHPMLYMKGVDKKLFSFLLDFIYLGEVSVPEDQFDSFIAMSKELKIKGLITEPTAEHTEDKNTNFKNQTLKEEIPKYTPIEDFTLNSRSIDDLDPRESPVKEESKLNVTPLLKLKFCQRRRCQPCLKNIPDDMTGAPRRALMNRVTKTKVQCSSCAQAVCPDHFDPVCRDCNEKVTRMTCYESAQD